MNIRNKMLVWMILLCSGVVLAGGAWRVDTKHTAHLDISTAANVVQVVNLVDFAGVDSFVYSDTINDTACNWTSPLQVMNVSVASVDNETAYPCSVTFAGSDILGVEVTSDANATLEEVRDSLVSKINQATNLTDSVTAAAVSDSVFSLTSNFGQEHFTDRWTVKTDAQLDTATSVITTIAMVADSMASYINAGQGLVTAANGGDTLISLTANTAGVAFTIIPGDTAQDTSLGTANTNSSSTRQDTIAIGNTFFSDWKAEGMYLVCSLLASSDTVHGIGKSDSAHLWVYYTFDQADYILADSAIGAIPLELRIPVPAAAGTDTVFKEGLSLVYWITDTASDTNMWIDYDIPVHYLLWQ